MAYLEIRGITKRFDRRIALAGVSAEINKGELVCVLGPSGCGKTTLLRIIAGLETADGGKIIIEGEDCTSLPASKRNFGIVFQSYALFPNMTVMGNVLFGLQQKKGLPRGRKLELAMDALELVDLAPHMDKYPRQLSGGQQQRTALARAIAISPGFLLLDEPLSALDAKVRAKLRGEIRDIQRRLGVTTVMVTHDQEEALSMADRIIVMNDAAVEQIGAPRDIYDCPATPFVANFIGTMNFFRIGGEIVAIRPEKIRLVDCFNHYDFTAQVRSIEFKGALSRICGILSGGTEICVDVPSETASRLGLQEGVTVFLKIPPGILMKYDAAV